VKPNNRWLEPIYIRRTKPNKIERGLYRSLPRPLCDPTHRNRGFLNDNDVVDYNKPVWRTWAVGCIHINHVYTYPRMRTSLGYSYFKRMLVLETLKESPGYLYLFGDCTAFGGAVSGRFENALPSKYVSMIHGKPQLRGLLVTWYALERSCNSSNSHFTLQTLTCEVRS
jgi:hypothetical protein